MKVFLLRHGETEYNQSDRLLGRTDLSLSREGVIHAKQIKEKLKDLRFERIYSSPLRRAVETAVIISGSDEDDILTDQRLMEIDYGPYEGYYFTDLEDEMFDFFRDPVNVLPPPGVEHISALMERSLSFLDSISKEGHENILVVTHGVMMRSFLGHVIGDGTGAVWGIPIENCQFFVLVYDGNKWGMGKD